MHSKTWMLPDTQCTTEDARYISEWMRETEWRRTRREPQTCTEDVRRETQDGRPYDDDHRSVTQGAENDTKRANEGNVSRRPTGNPLETTTMSHAHIHTGRPLTDRPTTRPSRRGDGEQTRQGKGRQNKADRPQKNLRRYPATLGRKGITKGSAIHANTPRVAPHRHCGSGGGGGWPLSLPSGGGGSVSSAGGGARSPSASAAAATSDRSSLATARSTGRDSWASAIGASGASGTFGTSSTSGAPGTSGASEVLAGSEGSSGVDAVISTRAVHSK